MASCRACAHPIESAEAAATCARCGALHVALEVSRAGVLHGTEDENEAVREVVKRLDAADVRRANDLYRETFACGLFEASRALDVLAVGGTVRVLSLVAPGPSALDEADLLPELRAKPISSSSA
jgi:hypothetical protein